MKGNFSVAILLLGVFVFVFLGVDYGVKYSIATVLIGFTVAFYHVWAYERRNVILLKKEIDQLKKPLLEQREEICREKINNLTYLERKILHHLVVSGQMLPAEEIRFIKESGEDIRPGIVLARISQKTQLINGTFAGHYIMNPEMRQYLESWAQVFSSRERVSWRNQISEFLDEGKKLQLRCMGEPENPELIELASDWGVRASTYLRSIELSFSAQFNAPERTNIPNSVWANKQVYSYIDPRLRVLRLLLDRLM